jgi:hypothetical protein
MPPYQPGPPIAATAVKPRNRAAAVALTLALLAWLAAALGIWLIVASHALTDGCLVDKELEGTGTLCLVGGYESKQQLGAGVVEWGEPDLVADEQVGPQYGVDDVAAGVVGEAADDSTAIGASTTRQLC